MKALTQLLNIKRRKFVREIFLTTLDHIRTTDKLQINQDRLRVLDEGLLREEQGEKDVPKDDLWTWTYNSKYFIKDLVTYDGILLGVAIDDYGLYPIFRFPELPSASWTFEPLASYRYADRRWEQAPTVRWYSTHKFVKVLGTTENTKDLGDRLAKSVKRYETARKKAQKLHDDEQKLVEVRLNNIRQGHRTTFGGDIITPK